MGFIGKVLSFTFLHAGQVDKPTPSFGSSTAFKTAVDSQAIQLQTGLNGLYDALNSTTPGSSGAENLGSAPITGVAGATPYAQMTDLKAQLNGAVTGQLPDLSLTTAKYQDGSITTSKLATGSVTLSKVNNNLKNMIRMGGMF